MTLVAGTTLGRYQIKSLLGMGGMGEVYRAYDPKIGRDAAIKVLPSNFSENKERVLYTSLTGDRNHYVVAADGQRFLIISPVDQGNKQPITFVANWSAGLRR